MITTSYFDPVHVQGMRWCGVSAHTHTHTHTREKGNGHGYTPAAPAEKCRALAAFALDALMAALMGARTLATLVTVGIMVKHANKMTNTREHRL